VSTTIRGLGSETNDEASMFEEGRWRDVIALSGVPDPLFLSPKSLSDRRKDDRCRSSSTPPVSVVTKSQLGSNLRRTGYRRLRELERPDNSPRCLSSM
jgi:hypothetical protein